MARLASRLIRRLALGFCLAFAASAALASAPVTLRDNPVDDDGQVTLGELFEGAGAAADIVIARRAGPTVVLDAGMVQSRAHQAGLAWSNPRGLRRVVVRQGSTTPAAPSATSAAARPGETVEVLTWTRSLAGLTVSGAGLERTIAASLSSCPEAIRPQVTQLVARINARWTTTAALQAFADDLNDETADVLVMHLLRKAELRGSGLAASLEDLAGKKVNFNTLGTAAAYSGPLIFSRLGINAENTFIPHQVALEQMRKGEMAGVVFITSKPVDAFVRGRFEPGFKFLPVAYDSRFEDYYLPAVLEAGEYPGLIKAGERVSTIAVPTALVAFNWAPQTNRYERVARFVDTLFSRVEKLQAPGFDPKWKSINLAATVPGLDRFPAAQDWLDRRAQTQRASR